MIKRIGLIAGNGKFPFIFAQAAKKKGLEVIAVAIKEETEPALEKCVDRIYWLSAGELEKAITILKDEKLNNIVMAGQVKHRILFDTNVKLDKKMQFLLNSLRNKKTDSIIGAIAFVLKRNGINLLNSTLFLSDLLPKKGVLTKTGPDKRVLEDIDFGRGIAKHIAGLDIGQSVVVKNKTALAIESIEGTDEAIRRAAKYGKEGIVVVKVSKPRQDMRFDVPVIGLETIRLLKEVQASGIAIEANKALIIDKDEAIKLADESGIVIVAM
jgi:DUF1009 family protein